MSRSLASAVGTVFSGRIIIILTTAVVTPVLTRTLGASLYGQYATIFAISEVLKVVMTSGINGGAKKYFSEDRSITRWKDHVWASYVRISLLIAGVVFTTVVLLYITGIFSVFISSTYAQLFLLLGIFLSVLQFRSLSFSTLMGLKLEKYSEPIKVSEKLLFGCTAVGLSVLGYGVVGVLTGHILSATISLLICVLIIRKRVDMKFIIKRSPKNFPKNELLKYGYGSAIYMTLLYSLYHVDILLLQAFTVEQTVGYYKAALTIIGFMWLLPQSLQLVLIQSVSNMWNENRIAEINRMSAKLTRYVFLLTFLMSIGLVILGEIFIPFYFGNDFTPAVTPLLVLLPGAICFSITRPYLAITSAKGNLRPLIIATAVAALINLLLNLLLIPRYGMIGAAIGTSTGYASLLGTQLLCARYVGYNPISGIRPIRILTTGIVTYIALRVFSPLLPTDVYRLLLIPLLGGIVFAGVAIVTGAIPFSDLRAIKRKAK